MLNAPFFFSCNAPIYLHEESRIKKLCQYSCVMTVMTISFQQIEFNDAPCHENALFKLTFC